MVDKAIISNKTALISKYGIAGFGSIQTALNNLIAVDAIRGLTTQTYFIDDPIEMRKVGGSCPVNVNDERGSKNAVDAIANHISPDYILLLDGPDVITHIKLNNPLPNDGDSTVDSDLPYASPASFSRQAARYLKVTRVVGRVPNLPGATTPERLINCLNVYSQHKPKPANNYIGYFGLSAQTWQASTEMSLDAVFGNHTNIDISPPSGPPANSANIINFSHFINCHGASISSDFYGQSGNIYPISLSSAQVSSSAPSGSVVAAECCYGAQLYDPILAGTADPICMAYLERGALGYVGSTTISYGPVSSNGQADLIAQYFFEEVLLGASTGRALLQARINFINSQNTANPSNLKTLAQFLLLGDPSATPCISTVAASATKDLIYDHEIIDETAQRKARRIQLTSSGLTMAAGKAVPDGPGEASEAVKDRVRKIAAAKGFKNQKEAIFNIRGGANFNAAIKAKSVKETVMIVSDMEDVNTHITIYKHLIAHLIGDGIASVEEIVSR